MAIEQWGFFNVSHLLRHGPTVYTLSHTHTSCRAFASGAVTSCFYDLGLSRPGIESGSPACEANALPLRHRGGCLTYKATKWDGLSDETAKTRFSTTADVARRSSLSVWQLTAKDIFKKKKHWKFTGMKELPISQNFGKIGVPYVIYDNRCIFLPSFSYKIT